MSDDQALRDAIRDRIADLGDDGVIVVGYDITAEVVTPDRPDPWLRTLGDDTSTPWAQLGRIEAIRMAAREALRAGWSDDDE